MIPIGSDGEAASDGSFDPGDSDAGGKAPQGAPTEGVACDFENPAWMGYVISAADMALGAGDQSGAGLCEGWVHFEREQFEFKQRDPTTGAKTAVTANGSTWYGPDCGTPHCGTLTFGDGHVELETCTIHAFCEEGVARSVGFTW